MSQFKPIIQRSLSLPVVPTREEVPSTPAAKVDLLFVNGPGERIADRNLLKFLINISGVDSLDHGDGIADLDTQALKNSIAQRLKQGGHVLLAGHGKVYEGKHYFQIAENNCPIRTREFLQGAEENQAAQEPVSKGETWHALVCESRNLYKEILPGSAQWRRGYVFIYGSSKKPVITSSVADSLEAMLRYVADCKRKQIDTDPLDLFLHLTKTQGDCITLLGGDLNAPLVSHAPKIPQDQTTSGRDARLHGDSRDLNQLQARRAALGHGYEPTSVEARAQLRSMLQARIDRNDLASVNEILSQHPALLSQQATGDTPLITASLAASDAILQVLLEHGANINEADSHGFTALMLALSFDHRISAAKFLMNQGADIFAQSALGQTALSLASTLANKEMLQLLLARGATADINHQDANGETALMLAASSGKLANVRLLLKAGANLWLKNSGGHTALQMAKANGHIHSAELISQYQKKQRKQTTGEEAHSAPEDFLRS